MNIKTEEFIRTLPPRIVEAWEKKNGSLAEAKAYSRSKSIQLAIWVSVCILSMFSPVLITWWKKLHGQPPILDSHFDVIVLMIILLTFVVSLMLTFNLTEKTPAYKNALSRFLRDLQRLDPLGESSARDLDRSRFTEEAIFNRTWAFAQEARLRQKEFDKKRADTQCGRAALIEEGKNMQTAETFYDQLWANIGLFGDLPGYSRGDFFDPNLSFKKT